MSRRVVSPWPYSCPCFLANGFSSELPITQETWLMNIELNNSSEDARIHENDIANNMIIGAGPSHHSSNIAYDIGNPQEEGMTQ